MISTSSSSPLINSKQYKRWLLLALFVGNVLEWYGFTLFIHFSLLIIPVFFPDKIGHIGLQFLTALLFASGFILRPIGGVLYGYWGDRFGRLNTLCLSISFMVIPTFLIGLLPDYSILGILSPILLIILRGLQGLSAGGEFPGSIAYAIENTESQNRGLWGSIPYASAFAGMLLAQFSAVIIEKAFTHQQVLDWAWRIPFLATIIFGIMAVVMRNVLTESPIFLALRKQKRTAENPLMFSLRNDGKKILIGLLITGISASVIYFFFIFMSNYLRMKIHAQLFEKHYIMMLSMCVLTLLVPIAGFLSDKLGRRPVMMCGCIGLIIDAYPLFLLFLHPEAPSIIKALGEILLATQAACVIGPLPAVLVELFPTKTRYTCIALSYNFAFAIFGGLAPFIGLYVSKVTGSTTSPSLYIIVVAIISFVLISQIKETHKQPLPA